MVSAGRLYFTRHHRLCGDWDAAFSNRRIHTDARSDAAVLLFPVLVPLLVASVKITQGALQKVPFSDYQGWFNLLLAYDLIFLVGAFFLNLSSKNNPPKFPCLLVFLYPLSPNFSFLENLKSQIKNQKFRPSRSFSVKDSAIQCSQLRCNHDTETSMV